MSLNLGKSLSREEMKNVKGGWGPGTEDWIHGCAPNGQSPYLYTNGCCNAFCQEIGTNICYDPNDASACLAVMT